MLLDSISLLPPTSPSHCCTHPLKIAADCRRANSESIVSPHSRPAASSSPHFRALSRLYTHQQNSLLAPGVLSNPPLYPRSGCSTIQPSAPSRVARLNLAPGIPIRATSQPGFADWTTRTDPSEPVARPFLTMSPWPQYFRRASVSQGSPCNQWRTYRQTRL